MIHITTVRSGLHVVAYTQDDDTRTVFVAAAFTRHGAEQKLLKTYNNYHKENR